MIVREWFLVLRASRDWRMFAGALVGALLATLLLGPKNGAVIGFVTFYGPPILAISLMAGLWEFAQRASVWALLAQRPGAERGRWWSLMRFCLLLYAAAGALLLAATVAAMALRPGVERTTVLATAVESTLWLAMVGAAVAATSTLRPTRSAALSLLWLVMPFIVTIASDALSLPTVFRDVLGFLAPPFDAVWDYSRVLAGELPGQAALYTAQVVAFPVLCLVLVGWRIRVLAQPDRPRVE